jgi:abequosyltransferase
MVFGINNKFLLTIAIPTWNRGESLHIALERLLNQICGLESIIEIIVSDNCSTDNTKEIVECYISKFPNLNIIYNLNESNIGFFSNFCKCRQLSSGRYLWVLSDDDYVCEEIIKEIIILLESNLNLSVLYLDNIRNKFNKKHHFLKNADFINKYRHKSGLISKVIFFNSKVYDNEIIFNYNNNGFIGWIFMLNSFRFNNRVLILSANSLETAKSIPKGYDYFSVFVNEIKDVTDFMKLIGLQNNIIKNFRRTYFIELIYHSYLIVKLYGFNHLHGGKLVPRSILTIEREIEYYFYDDHVIKKLMSFTIKLTTLRLTLVYYFYISYFKIKDKLW